MALIDGITAGDGLERVTIPILSGLPLQLGRVPCRAACESEIGAGGLDDHLIEFVEITGGKSGPLDRAIEGMMNQVHEGHRLGYFIPARLCEVTGELSEV